MRVSVKWRYQGINQHHPCSNQCPQTKSNVNLSPLAKYWTNTALTLHCTVSSTFPYLLSGPSCLLPPGGPLPPDDVHPQRLPDVPGAPRTGHCTPLCSAQSRAGGCSRNSSFGNKDSSPHCSSLSFDILAKLTEILKLLQIIDQQKLNSGKNSCFQYWLGLQETKWMILVKTTN